jgi:hypothetical protein
MRGGQPRAWQMRTLASLILVWSLAACGGTTAVNPVHPPTVKTRISPSSARVSSSGVTLGPDGVGTVMVGESQASAMSTMSGYFGAPLVIGGGGCAGRTEVHWGDLSLEFYKDTLAGYRYLNGPQTWLGAKGPVPKPNTPPLGTAQDATIGMTLAHVRALYPPSDFSLAHDGSIAMPGTSGDWLWLSFFGTRPSTRLWEIKGGAPCGDL